MTHEKKNMKKKFDERKGEVVKRKKNSKAKNVYVVKEVASQVRMMELMGKKDEICSYFWIMLYQF